MTPSTAADRPIGPTSPATIESSVHPEAPTLEATRRRIDEFADLGPDWDSYGGEPSSPIARAEAKRWVEIVADLFGTRAGAAARPYSIAPLVDGGVQLEWHGPLGIVELEVGPAGELGYLFLTDDEPSNDRAQVADDASWSEVLWTLLRALAA